MKQTTLKLKPGVSLLEQEGKIGVSLQGRQQLARSALQGGLLRALGEGGQTLEALHGVAHSLGAPSDDNGTALLLAEFILDFGDYLES